MHLASDHVHPAPGWARYRVRIFVPDVAEPGELLGDRAVVICSEAEGNTGARVTEAVEEIHESVARCIKLVDPVWIEHHGPCVTDGAPETWELVVFPAFGRAGDRQASAPPLAVGPRPRSRLVPLRPEEPALRAC